MIAAANVNVSMQHVTRRRYAEKSNLGDAEYDVSRAWLYGRLYALSEHLMHVVRTSLSAFEHIREQLSVLFKT